MPKAPVKVEKAPKAKKAATVKEKEKPKDTDTNKEYMKVLMDMGFNEKLSKAALTKVENQGVTEALMVAIKLQGEPEYQEAPTKKVAPDAKVALKAWNCPACTLYNQPGMSACGICGAEVSAEALVDDVAEK